MANGWAKICAHLAEGDPHAAWYREALHHAGIRVEVLEAWMPSEIQRAHVMLLCGTGSTSPAQQEGLRLWVQQGGCLVVSGGTWGLETLLGVAEETHVSVGRLECDVPDRLIPDGPGPKFFGGSAVRCVAAREVARCPRGTVVARHQVGQGCVLFVGFHLGQTFTQMVMGRSVEVDGLGAEDGSAPIDDGILRSEDGMALDFQVDRTSLEGEVPFFGVAHADLLREIWIRAILEAVETSGTSTALLWRWAGGASATATLSLDVLEPEIDQVIGLQRMLQMFGCPATWLVALPGYPADVYRALRAMEHEVGLLFHIEEGNGWHEERLRIQLTNLTRLASWPHLGSVRVQGGQWKGWNHFYVACETAGARISLNKMGRYPGTAGFLFGTCQPFVVPRKDGHDGGTMEIPGHVWSPGEVVSEQVCAAIVAAVAERNGCFHFAMHPEAIHEPSVSMAVRRILTSCKDQRFTFVKPEDIARHERSRRALRLALRRLGDADQVQLTSEWDIPGLTVLISGPPRMAKLGNANLRTQPVTRYGMTFTQAVLDVEARTQMDLEFTPVANDARRAA